MRALRMLKFTVLKTIWSRFHEKEYQPGEVIEYPPLPKVEEGAEYPAPFDKYPDIQLMLETGIVEKLSQEVTNG